MTQGLLESKQVEETLHDECRRTLSTTAVWNCKGERIQTAAAAVSVEKGRGQFHDALRSQRRCCCSYWDTQGRLWVSHTKRKLVAFLHASSTYEAVFEGRCAARSAAC